MSDTRSVSKTGPRIALASALLAVMAFVATPQPAAAHWHHWHHWHHYWGPNYTYPYGYYAPVPGYYYGQGYYYHY
jgi:hypothetical protein